MSTDRANSARPLKPTLASNRTPTTRTPLTPRIASTSSATSSHSTTSTSVPPRASAPKLSNRNSVVSPRVRPQDTPAKDGAGTINVTPRSSARKSRVGVSQDTTSLDDVGNEPSVKVGLSPNDALSGRISGLSLTPSLAPQSRARGSRPTSVVGESTSRPGHSPPQLRSPGILDAGTASGHAGIESRFFHASEARKPELAPKRPEPKKTPSFFYADGKQDKTGTSSRPRSPVLSAVSERRPAGPWIKPEGQTHPARSPPTLSPAPIQPSSNQSYFPPTIPLQEQLRSPSPSKENIHLSYRKGASQIFGFRPTPRLTPSLADLPFRPTDAPKHPSTSLHRKSSSLSSLNSSGPESRRRSTTAPEDAHPYSPLTHEIKSVTVSRVTSPSVERPSIDTSLGSLVGSSFPDGALSPTKAATQLAADARRERKVLDLEISNSSLMAINSSLEREVRRQKAELKRFRRLSRAGRFSNIPIDQNSRIAEDLSTLGEEDQEEHDYNVEPMAEPAGLGDDDMSDSEEDSLSGSEPRSPGAHANKQHDRLEKDEKRLRVDLERHKELLVQTQAMNQSLKRCMYATDEMIRDGRRALAFSVQVSDIKLGGRILTGDDEVDDTHEMMEFDDDAPDDMESAKTLLDVWSGLGQSAFDGSDGPGDRDSGIEVDKPFASTRHSNVSNVSADSGRPPEDAS